ncbi:hypothetical protein B0H17DRAFT_1154026 [Mycena rosella]|uniref:Uncharacterized protein n=1 Tax=Mycena rosella TaxID=1033263 RepID=A0AAD7B0L7_MYCRO|nr:hypothetical protein B0H17DRAFT_1154026 [Mycena rosella]
MSSPLPEEPSSSCPSSEYIDDDAEKNDFEEDAGGGSGDEEMRDFIVPDGDQKALLFLALAAYQDWSRSPTPEVKGKVMVNLLQGTLAVIPKLCTMPRRIPDNHEVWTDREFEHQRVPRICLVYQTAVNLSLLMAVKSSLTSPSTVMDTQKGLKLKYFTGDSGTSSLFLEWIPPAFSRRRRRDETMPTSAGRAKNEVDQRVPNGACVGVGYTVTKFTNKDGTPLSVSTSMLLAKLKRLATTTSRLDPKYSGIYWAYVSCPNYYVRHTDCRDSMCSKSLVQPSHAHVRYWGKVGASLPSRLLWT